MRKTLAAVAALAAAGIALAAPSRLENKIIAYGWDTIFFTPEDVLANAEAFDATPVDGVGTMIKDRSVFTADMCWTKENCARYVELFRKYREHRALRDSFVAVMFQPDRRLSLKEDAGWAHAATNLATVAWIVREAGLPGIIFDTEDYRKSQQFLYRDADRAEGLSYAEASALARRRGRELFAPVFREHPGIKLMSFYFLIATPYYERYYRQHEPAAAAELTDDLWLAFVNGMLDVAPETARIFDGNEDAYWHQAHLKSFDLSYTSLHRRLLNVIEPENRDKFHTVMRLGHGLYLDMYVNEKGTTGYYFGERTPESRRVHRFAENVEAAVSASDGYIWLYGERRNFVPWKTVHPRRAYPYSTNATWEASLPGFHKAIRFAKDPYAAMMAGLKAAKAEAVTAVATNEYVTALENGASHSFTVRNLAPGGYYAFTGEKRGEKAEANLVPSKGMYENWTYSWHYPALLEKDAEGWIRFANYVRVPPDCDGFKVFQSSRKGHPKAEFRNFKVVRLD